MNKNLIILDWDDTLFPTSWIIKNNINIQSQPSLNKYIILFGRLDALLSKLLKNLLNHSIVIIVTNANYKWITTACSILPNTKTIIKKRIQIISARDELHDIIPKNFDIYKKIIFNRIVKNIIKKNKLNNIISIGDAEYEYQALINLYHLRKKNNLYSFFNNGFCIW